MKKEQGYLSANNIKYVDYKDLDLIRMFLNPNGQISGKRRSNLSAKEQRMLALAVKRARFMALLPYIAA
ncbi:MAG: 30S ribosomal protein S18 [Candidatus Lloydbacteria bacterium RIFCSPHIGHO2_02_FULL_54_17]|uniref:Small ribosomal subunit protein bS18 n=1 Tax=Candidatus Lloydbacteria bacterium RIFCSPHIGHO2_02_FULL_54_17 TaxID=1798664 RepID=A0A1G2DDY7_9BACT|nr:MAG: 30S ribosomal protein S18 [Candidatus Lloydbacteria bacterium RIFCSPHIGHO2_01_FULL_54_11]OGZ10998.1 MAG: 30S ribosomal protein S18 [Candidatus Lloydbacteria bacterium RIFCSPHIGHO2_02_FULL_54_17]OGZ13149.1 MAG: 30S ribosomal protein S18 [Candidatus Lloydbacteria bacterium RIFCSPLOWO2_01_FULL_54_18]OGZ15490.1 MAG: 30S ribosomal protein S18 [Candidatus Lloydbacteria bacterium RIFCSPLOWO2_02_FULL_54_12]